MSEPTRVVVRDEFLAELTKKYGDQITALAPEGATPAHYAASLRLYIANNPQLLDCTTKSVMVGMLRVAQTGLQLGVSCDLLVFGKTCQYVSRYNGLIELALGSGTRAINSDVVREGDVFEMEKGTRPFLRHRRVAKADARITGAYAVGETKVNSFVMEYLDRDQLDADRKRYSRKWWEEKEKKTGRVLRVIPLEEIPWWARKTMVRRLSSSLPKNPRLAAAMMFAEEKEEEEIPVGHAEPMPVDADTETGEIKTPAPVAVESEEIEA